METAIAFRDLMAEQPDSEDEFEDRQEQQRGETDSEEAKQLYEKKRANVVQAILRQNMLAMGSLKAIGDSLKDDEFSRELDQMQRSQVKLIGDLMPQERVRPSLLTPANSLLACLMATSGLTLGEHNQTVLLAAFEKSI